jgi:toxin ParE1/3/4
MNFLVSPRSALRAHCEKICLNPAGYRRRPELSDDLRSCAHGNCVIFFESTTEQVIIVRILHGGGARDIPEVLTPRKVTQFCGGSAGLMLF